MPTFARTEPLAEHLDAGVVQTVVVVQATERAVRAVVRAAQERWLHYRARVAFPGNTMNLLITNGNSKLFTIIMSPSGVRLVRISPHFKLWVHK